MKGFIVNSWILVSLVGSTAFGAQVLTHPYAASSSASASSQLQGLHGEYVLFASSARNLVTNRVSNKVVNVYRHDLQRGETVLVSAGLSGEGGSGDSAWASAATNGRWVAFISDAADLVSYDTNAAADVFLRDVTSQTTYLVSHGVEGEVAKYPGFPRNKSAMISADGNWVVYESMATNLTSEVDTNGAADVFAYHVATGTNGLVSRSTKNPGESVPGGATLVGITPSGRRVAFISSAATNLMSGVTNTGTDLFVRDLVTGELLWGSPVPVSYSASYRCEAGVISEDGSAVAFLVSSPFSAPALFHCNLASGTATLVSLNLRLGIDPQISGDGRYVAFDDGANAYRWDAASQASIVLNVKAGGQPAENSTVENIIMSANGQFAGFLSDSGDLTTNALTGGRQLFLRDLNTQTTTLITTTPSGNGMTASSARLHYAISSDGARVAFDSASKDLVASDHNDVEDVFVRDIVSKTTALISGHALGKAAQTAAAHALIHSAGVNGDGSAVTLLSFDSDIAPDDTNRAMSAFVISTTDTPAALIARDDPVRSAVISADGRYVVLDQSRRANLSAPEDKLVRLDRFTGFLEAISGPNRVDDNASAAINADGQRVAYRALNNQFVLYNFEAGSADFTTNLLNLQPLSVAGDLVDALFTPDSRFLFFRDDIRLYMLDRVAGTMTVSNAFNSIAVSANSRFLAYMDGSVLRRNLLAGTNLSIGVPLLDLAISGDGHYITGATSNSRPQIVVFDCQTGASNLVSVSRSGQPGDGASRYPVITPDGRFVAFLTAASNLVDGNPNRLRQIVVRDRLLGTTIPITVGAGGALGDDHSSKPILSADGRTLFFQSMAENLVANDFNDRRDIFAVTLSGADSDADGLDDTWEAAYFGNLSRDGSGDYDADGVSDRDEFLAGTDPTNSGSIFRVIVVKQLGVTQRGVKWEGNPQGSYRVEYKDDLASPAWTPLDASISWNGSTATATDDAAAVNRFYRVVRLP